MAIFNSTILEGATGSVGNITLCKYKKKNVVKSKIFFKSKKTSPAQHMQQTRFKLLSQQANMFYHAAIVGFPGASWSEARNAFIKHNQHIVKIDETTSETTIALEEVCCSVGKLTPPDVQASILDDEHTIHVKWFRQPLSPVAKDDDDLYLFLFDTKKQDSFLYLLGKRGTPDEKIFSIYEKLTSKNVLAYAFVRSSSGTNASNTIFINLEHITSR